MALSQYEFGDFDGGSGVLAYDEDGNPIIYSDYFPGGGGGGGGLDNGEGEGGGGDDNGSGDDGGDTDTASGAPGEAPVDWGGDSAPTPSGNTDDGDGAGAAGTDTGDDEGGSEDEGDDESEGAPVIDFPVSLGEAPAVGFDDGDDSGDDATDVDDDTSPPVSIARPILGDLNIPNDGGGISTMTYQAPVAQNANTTYGNDLSEENNFGLGSDFQSTNTLAKQQAANQAVPSWLWLVAAAVLLWVVLK